MTILLSDFAGSSSREVLAADLLLFVRTDGNDANTGRDNTAGSAFLTIQRAFDELVTIEQNGWNVGIIVAPGTYAEGGAVIYTQNPAGGGIYLYGDAGAPSSCVISGTGTLFEFSGNDTHFFIEGFKLVSSASHAIVAGAGALVEVSAMEYGACAAGYHLYAKEGGTIFRVNDDEITGGALAHMRAANGGRIYGETLDTTALSGTPAFSVAFAVADSLGLITDTRTYVGSATGPRYNVSINAVIDVNGASETFYPGDAVGVKSGGGQYIGTPSSGGIAASDIYGKETLFIPAVAIRPTVSNGCAPINDIETTAGRPDMTVLDFSGSVTQYAQFQVAFPKKWNLGTVTFQAFWTTAGAVTTGVAWGLQGVAVGDNSTIDVVYGTAVIIQDDAQGQVEEELVTAESAAITIAGTPAVDQMCYFRIFRKHDDANDDMVEAARLIGIKLFYTTSALNDA